MKKVIAILTLVLIGVLAQSCGSGEKCPAYSYNTTAHHSEARG